MSVNEKQIGGNHYRCKYQHWDFVTNNELHYLQGCATKYLARYRKKNGLQDLEKAVHYVEKLKEVYEKGMKITERVPLFEIRKFCEANDVGEEVQEAIAQMLNISSVENLNKSIKMINIIHSFYKKELDAKVDNTGQEHPFGYDAMLEGAI